jgi:hypothetical protein
MTVTLSGISLLMNVYTGSTTFLRYQSDYYPEIDACGDPRRYSYGIWSIQGR